MELNKKNILKILGMIAFAIILCALLMNFGAVLKWLGFIWGVCFPFILGAGIAFCLNIPMSFFERKIFGAVQNRKDSKKSTRVLRKLARPVSLVLTLLAVVVVLAIVVGVLVPQLASTFESVGITMAAFMPKAQVWLEELFADNEEIVSYISSIELDWGSMLESVKNFVFNGAGNVLSYTMSATVRVVNFFTTFFISVIFSIYVLMQKENLARQLTKLIKAVFKEKIVEKICYVCSLSHRTFSKFIAGQCVEALILGTMFVVIMAIFRFPYALLIGILIAFTALIPVVGAFVGCFIGAFLILMVNPMQALAFIILFLVLQQVEGNLIYPHVVGNSVGLPSMWVLFAVTVGGSLMGVIGMLIFIPLMSVIYSLLREWVNLRLKGKDARTKKV